MKFTSILRSKSIEKNKLTYIRDSEIDLAVRFRKICKQFYVPRNLQYEHHGTEILKYIQMTPLSGHLTSFASQE